MARRLTRLIVSGMSTNIMTFSCSIDGTAFRSAQTLVLTIIAFRRSLEYGTKYIYRALPRMLTIYLEYGDDAELIQHARAKKKQMCVLNPDI